MLDTALFKHGTGSKALSAKTNGETESLYSVRRPKKMYVNKTAANLPSSPLPLADNDSPHRLAPPWSFWPHQRCVMRPWQNAAVSSTPSHCWRRVPLTKNKNETNVTQVLAADVLFSLRNQMCVFCTFVWFTRVSWINPSHHGAVRSIHKVFSLCH